VLNIVQKEKPEGRDRPVRRADGRYNLAIPLENAGVKILGTSPDSIIWPRTRAFGPF